jgi:hypothetical protein
MDLKTLLGIHSVGPDAPQRPRHWSYGPPSSDAKIDVLNGFARDFAVFDRDGAFSLKWIPKGAAHYKVDRIHHHLTRSSSSTGAASSRSACSSRRRS